jgi:glycosyltransferase involved in cell wall biosynthesis
MPCTPCSIEDFAFVQAKAPPRCEDDKRWPGNFRTWIENNETITESDRAAIRGRIAGMPQCVRISVLMPVHNPEVAHLIAAINSVRRQLYPYWELCIADDCSTSPDVLSVLQRFGNRDPRIKVMYRTQPGHIARTSNDALAMATGEFVALLDHDDLLPEHALYMVAEEVNAHPNVGLMYSDEDKVDTNNVRYGPYFKQHFNRDILLGQNCVNHLGVFRRTSTNVRFGIFRISCTIGAQHRAPRR